MNKSILLIWILICSGMVCQAEDTSTACNCRISFALNESENNTICFEDVCKELTDEELNNIIKGKADDVDLNAVYHESNSDVRELMGIPDAYVRRLTYEVTLSNNIDNPEIDNLTLEATLCDGVVYESSEYLVGNAVFYEPTVIQDHTTHTTSKIGWWIGTLEPGEERTIILNVQYIYQEAPEIEKTEFVMKARLWGKEFTKKNDNINPS